MNTPRMCPNGHEAEADAQYCSECGQPVAAQWTSLPLPPSSKQNHDPSSVGGPKPDAWPDSTGATGGDDMTDTLISDVAPAPVPKRVFGWVKRHKVWSAVIAVVAVFFVLNVAVVNHADQQGGGGSSGGSSTSSINTNSQSYQDGYTWGSTGGLGVAYLCTADSVYGDDDPYNFMAGCTAAADGLRNGTIPNGY